MNSSTLSTDYTFTRTTPFHSRIDALCRSGKWGNWAGYRVVEEYTSAEHEYFAVRNQSAVFDLTPMIKYRISGADSVAYLNRLVTRDVNKIKPGRVAYVLFCNARGHIIDDGTLFHIAENHFMFCSQERHFPWLQDSAQGFAVEIVDVTEEMASLALQGPTSCAILQKLGLSEIVNLKPFELREFPYEKGRILVSRTGFTGDLGYELWIENHSALAVWDGLFLAGREHGIRPLGSYALDWLRIEGGFIAPHQEFLPANHLLRLNRGRTPAELGYQRLVDFDKGHFNGRAALLAEKKRGPRLRLVGLEIEGNKPATHAWIYHRKLFKVGHVTSAIWSPTCKRNIALALLKPNFQRHLWADIYIQKELQWERSMKSCKIVSRPFFNPPRRNAVPALNF